MTTTKTEKHDGTDSIVVIGGGYVGLTAAVAFAYFGFNVTCIESNPKRLAALKAGKLPFHEEGLLEEMNRMTARGRLFFSDEDSSISAAQAVFLAVGTPTIDGVSDLSQLLDATHSVARKFRGPGIIVNKSTVPPGTAGKIEEIIAGYPNCEADVVSNPEFLREGTAWHDFLHPDRIVIGCRSDRAEAMMRRLYHSLMERTLFLRTSHRSAEIIKQASNAYLATRLGFLHHISDLCERAGADIVDVARGIGADQRIGSAFLKPGPGYGGGCLPKDVASLIGEFKKWKLNPTILKAVDSANIERRRSLAERIAALLPKDPLVTIFGLTFKAGTSDLRESPALYVAHHLVEKGVRLHVHDPYAERQEIPSFQPPLVIDQWFDNPYLAVKDVDAVVILTEWKSFTRLDWQKIASSMRGRVVFDARNICDGATLKRAGLDYHRLGTKNPPASSSTSSHSTSAPSSSSTSSSTAAPPETPKSSPPSSPPSAPPETPPETPTSSRPPSSRHQG